MAEMGRYWQLVRAGWRRNATYRAATFAGAFTNIVFGFLRAAVLIATLKVAGHIGGYDRADALTYTWLTQGLIMVIAIWRWNDLALRIQTGAIATDLSRPIDVQGAWLAEDLGRAAYQGVFRGLPPFIIGALFFTLRLPHHAVTWLAFAASIVLAVVVSFGMRFIVNLCAFWLLDWRGLDTVSSLLVTVLSGFSIPLNFYPHWARTITELLPWGSMVQLPINIFLEQERGSGVVGLLLLQAMWAVVLLAVGRRLLAAGTRKLVVQGG
jgi:ABC-2 type transport system permease protein